MNLPNLEELSFLMVLAFPKASRTGLHLTSCSSKLLPSVLLVSTPHIEAKYWITEQGNVSNILGGIKLFLAFFSAKHANLRRFFALEI